MTSKRFENGERVIANWNRVFRALTAEPRRQLLVSLLDTARKQSVSLPESAINPTVPRSPNSLRSELFHCHLPLLAEMGFIEWESTPLVAFRGPRFQEAAVVLELLHSNADQIPEALITGCQRLEQERHFAE